MSVTAAEEVATVFREFLPAHGLTALPISATLIKLETNPEGKDGMALPDQRLSRLLEVGRTLVAELGQEALLERILEQARELTGARYAALGILDEDRKQLERFLTAGIDEPTHRAIGELPRGRGVLGVLVNDARPLRLADVGEHPESFGFPPEHPPMRSFLGVPILIRGRAWGNLYLTEKRGGEQFDQTDEDAAVALSQWAAIAIENARIHELSERHRDQLAHAVRALEAARDITEAIGGVAELGRVLELIVKRGRALVDARTLLVMLREQDELVVAASAGHAPEAQGQRLPIGRSTSGQVLHRGRSARIDDVAAELRIDPEEFGVAGAHTALLVPMLHRGAAIGILAAFDHGEEHGEFSGEDERLLRAFAQSAANAVAMNRSVEADRLRAAIAASDAERARWARELHDQTLQALGGLRVLLASTVGRGDSASRDGAMRQAIEDIELEIANLRDIISDLRPSLLDDLGLVPALESLLDRRRNGALHIEADLRLPGSDGALSSLGPELETTVYRLVQEALTNVVKHSGASRVQVAIGLEGGEMVVEVQDDGRGFDVAARTSGFGLAGMRERVTLAGGTLEIQSTETGTFVSARLPALADAVPIPAVGHEQAAS